MPYKIVRDKSKYMAAYNSFVNNDEFDETKLGKDLLNIRDFFVNTYNRYEKFCSKDYELDLKLALDFYEFMQDKKDFTPNVECDDDFWRNIAIYVIPDIIAKRHPNKNSEYYYSKNVRVYPYVLYWYIKLSWQGSKEETYEILKNNSTDEIMQMVERPSTIGINVELYREIMKRFSEIPQNKKTININGQNKKIFRLIFIKNTAKLSITRPEIYPGGIKNYVDMLFEDFI